jgi:3-oxoacyl-[acyl-carrier protein] reductase
VALVVGGAGAVGAATGRLLARGGATVVLTNRPGEERAAAAARIVAGLPGAGHAASPADVADTATLLALRDTLAARHGRLDILVNAAGFTRPVPRHDLDALDDDLIDRMFRVNWRGQFAAVRTVAPLLKASEAALSGRGVGRAARSTSATAGRCSTSTTRRASGSRSSTTVAPARPTPGSAARYRPSTRSAASGRSPSACPTSAPPSRS